MAKVIDKFTGFMKYSIMFLLIIALITGVGLAGISLEAFNRSIIVFAVIAILAIFLGHKIINMDMTSRKKLVIILLIGLTVRLLWILNVNSVPTSDFRVIYLNAGNFINGDRNIFYGKAYLARFPHLTITTLYVSIIRYIFPVYNLLVIKFINLTLSIFVLVLLYLIINEVYKNKDYALKGTFIGALFPPFISYVGVFCSENIAIPLYLISIYLFLKAIKTRKSFKLLVLSGVALAVGNLFRMVAIIILIAYSIYILIYYKDTLLRKVKKIILIIVSYALIICSVSGTLQTLKITEYPLWGGSEPDITSILKGTNYNSLGAWNEEDAKTIQDNLSDYEKLVDASKEIIKERLTTTPIYKLAFFYLGKFSVVWGIGDCSGVLWSQSDLNINKIAFPIKDVTIINMPISLIFQLIYLLILALALLGLIKKNKNEFMKEINLFYLIFLGYVCMYLLTEAQPRYSYIVSWIFIVLSINGFDYLKLNYNSHLSNTKANF